jgi:two-component system chemotaxis response regulator CheB
VVQILKTLPAEFTIPILLVVHISEPFGAAFADWLDGQTGRRVICARDGDSLQSAQGRVLVAPAGFHMIMDNERVRLTAGPPRHSCRPSVDELFESVARHSGRNATACLLTGMGRDGAAGLLAIRQAGGFTIAQDEATSVVYGMPKEAILLGAAEQVLPLDRIGLTLAGLKSEWT